MQFELRPFELKILTVALLSKVNYLNIIIHYFKNDYIYVVLLVNYIN